ncbi:transcriptional regulator TyrR [Alteromonas confluentis]|uniref:HTH-type transcriptional regulatory protein TyrR n=1 Tax=Alteromonas confluentis TaxID=1656094 RepID=A0A1E7Z634_9ALTE|nr:transcriptional regulator TyrR [Alteromonas confluentis]OFC68881.1 DNA-binding transcriptional regulator TyrR [Alteromonas confluentis]
MRLEISCQDRLGITQDILDILVEHEIDLRGIEIDVAGKIFLNFPNIEFEDFQHLMPKIRRINGIDDVKTTPFMPGERERHQLSAILRTLPDPVFSIDNRCRILMCNEAVMSGMEMPFSDIKSMDVGELVKNFNFTRWMENEESAATSVKVKFIQQDYLADVLPVTVPDGHNQPILAGAVVILKSEIRLGQQFSAFHQVETDSFDHFITRSAAMAKVVNEAKQIADLDAPVLIFGETGTGKEMIAKACHQASRRHKSEFLVLNCASLPDSVAESELFGYAAGAYNQPDGKVGLLELAEGGTLLLDEIADMSPQLQAKLLRVLENNEFRRVGGDKPVEVNVRFICTTSRDLGQLVEEGVFRKDLYYRLNVLSLVMPSLKERRQDILPLAESFILQHSGKLGRRPAKLSKSCVDFLQQYPWPGNVRQLQNALFRALSLLDGNEITKEDIQLPSCAPSVTYIDENFDGTLDEEVKKFERDLLKRLYPSYPSTRQLAKKLGLSHTAIANKLREYGINKSTVKL